MSPTIAQARAQAAARLSGHSTHPQLDADTLLAFVLPCERAYLFAHPERQLTPEQHSRLNALLLRRAAHEPLQYITGLQEFYGRPFTVTPAALIPRPETELLVEAALDVALDLLRRTPSPQILDVGTGTGCIAITLALELNLPILATDISLPALALARENARRLQAPVAFAATDLLAALTGPFDLIVSNPPYVPEHELATLEPEVRDHEPRQALTPGPEGTEIYARLISQAHAALRPGGHLALELGYASAPHVLPLLAPTHWTTPEIRPDLQAWPRILLARRIP